MDEYISREETAKAFCEKCRGYYDGHCIHRGECDVDVIQTAPAADVQLVKHGRWIRKHNSFPQRYFCTECGGGDVGIFTFCHYCGARMDGDSK